MPVFNLYSKRQRQIRGELPDVYSYDKIPLALRNQLFQIISEGLGFSNISDPWAREIQKALCREYGRDRLSSRYVAGIDEDIKYFIVREASTDHVLDFVELSLQIVDDYVRTNRPYDLPDPDSVIGEANIRFREHGIGFEFASGEIIRIDSQILHQEVVKPALLLLAESRFTGANLEFLRAHEHYRHGNFEECISECLKSFESTMKIICDAMGWSYSSNASASALIEICTTNNLFPGFLQSHLGSLRSILESGIPTLRNKQSGHGRGTTNRTVTRETASFALHTTATNILFFVESFKSIKK